MSLHVLRKDQDTETAVMLDQLRSWVNEGDRGEVLCETCKKMARHGRVTDDCAGCFGAWREIFGEVEVHGTEDMI